jgi:hypothetical protein
MAYARFFEEDRPISWARGRPIIEIVALIAAVIHLVHRPRGCRTLGAKT